MQTQITTKQYYVLLLVGLIVLSIALLFRTTMPSVMWGISLITFIICVFGTFAYWRKTGQDIAEKCDFSQVTVYIFAGLYGIIAGFAIKNSIESTAYGIIEKITLFMEEAASKQFLQIIMNVGQNSYELAMFSIFLFTAIPFYHGAMIFLSKESRQKPESRTGTTLHFGCLFIQAMIFLTISIVLQTFVLVVMLLIFLMIVDSVWIILAQKTLHKPPLGWLSTNLAFTMTLFLAIYSNWDLASAATFLAIACIVRTIVDYAGFTDVYFPKNFLG